MNKKMPGTPRVKGDPWPYNIFYAITGEHYDLITEDQEQGLEYVVSELPSRQHDLILEHYKNKKPITEIAAELGLTTAQCYNIRNAALKILRHPAYKNFYTIGYYEVKRVKLDARETKLKKREMELDDYEQRLELRKQKLEDMEYAVAQKAKDLSYRVRTLKQNLMEIMNNVDMRKLLEPSIDELGEIIQKTEEYNILVAHHTDEVEPKVDSLELLKVRYDTVPIKELQLNKRTHNILTRRGICTLGQLADYCATSSLFNFYMFGVVCMRDLQEKLEAYTGLTFSFEY